MTGQQGHHKRQSAQVHESGSKGTSKYSGFSNGNDTRSISSKSGKHKPNASGTNFESQRSIRNSAPIRTMDDAAVECAAAPVRVSASESATVRTPATATHASASTHPSAATHRPAATDSSAATQPPCSDALHSGDALPLWQCGRGGTALTAALHTRWYSKGEGHNRRDTTDRRTVAAAISMTEVIGSAKHGKTNSTLKVEFLGREG